MNIIPLFPTAVGRTTLDRSLSESELKFINELEVRPNKGNTTSKNSYVLKEKPLEKLAEFCLESANKYFQEVYKPKEDLNLYITQSWVNYTERGGFHHKHSHQNSFISGVFYVNASVESDKVYFYNESYKQIKVQPTEWNVWNSESWWLEVSTGTLYLFPSSLTHDVPGVENDGRRISLSFNTFIKGAIGSYEHLAELVI